VCGDELIATQPADLTCTEYIQVKFADLPTYAFSCCYCCLLSTAASFFVAFPACVLQLGYAPAKLMKSAALMIIMSALLANCLLPLLAFHHL
jgi:hypothetical protein